jgi:hypothetical protein
MRIQNFQSKIALLRHGSHESGLDDSEIDAHAHRGNKRDLKQGSE